MTASCFSAAATAYTPDGQTLLVGGVASSGLGVLALYSASTGTLIRTISNPGMPAVNSITFTPDGSTFATVGNGITMWHTSTFTSYYYHGDMSGTMLAFSPDSSLIAWAEKYLTTVQVAPLGGPTRGSFDNGSAPTAFSFSSNGGSIYTVTLQNIKRWDTASLTLRETFQAEHIGQVLSVALSPDGRTIATGSSDTTIKLWHKQNGALIRTLIGEGEAVFSVAFSPDGQTLISGGFVKGVGDYSNDGMPDIVLQNAATNQVIIWTMNGLSFVASTPLTKMRERKPFVGRANPETGYRCRFTVRPDWKRLPAPSGGNAAPGFEYATFGAPPDQTRAWINKRLLHRATPQTPSISLSDGPLNTGRNRVDIVQGYPELPKGFNGAVTRRRHLTIDGYHATQLTIAYGKHRTTGLLVYVPDHSLLFAVGSSIEYTKEAEAAGSSGFLFFCYSQLHLQGSDHALR